MPDGTLGKTPVGFPDGAKPVPDDGKTPVGLPFEEIPEPEGKTPDATPLPEEYDPVPDGKIPLAVVLGQRPCTVFLPAVAVSVCRYMVFVDVNPGVVVPVEVIVASVFTVTVEVGIVVTENW